MLSFLFSIFALYCSWLFFGLYFLLTWFWSCSWSGIRFLILVSSVCYTIFIIWIAVMLYMIKMRMILSIFIVVIFSFIMQTLLYFLPNLLFLNFFWSLRYSWGILGMVVHLNILVNISKYLSPFFLRMLFFILLMWLSFDVILLLAFFALHGEIQKRNYVDVNVQNRQLWQLKMTQLQILRDK